MELNELPDWASEKQLESTFTESFSCLLSIGGEVEIVG